MRIMLKLLYYLICTFWLVLLFYIIIIQLKTLHHDVRKCLI